MPLTVHMIGNAHLDPVWLWGWERGSDEAVATCRAACDLLDDDPDATFTRGEAWVYEQVRTLAPLLFDRIRRHVESGRWEVVNGWWVQPDVNLPVEEGILRSIELGHHWFREHLGLEGVPIGYNVDSFGHGAYLPSMMSRMGQRYYVMMRPSQEEMALPSNLFRWVAPDGAEVLAFRINGGYLSMGPRYGLEAHVQHAIDYGPRETGHVMCFYGVGDHGGGPTREAVRWIHDHRDFAEDVRLEFSTCRRFFAAVEPFREQRPVVATELQHHAIGCYSVCAGLKQAVRGAEHALLDAESLVRRAGAAAPADAAADLRDAWRGVCFNHFHDILAGSSILEGCDAACRTAGEARARAERLGHRLLRRELGISQECLIEGQRLHLVNRLDRPWSGLAEAELWLDWQSWDHSLLDADGNPVPVQQIESASLMCEPGCKGIPRLLIPVDLPAGGSRSFAIVPGQENAPYPPGESPRYEGGALGNGAIRVEFVKEGVGQITLCASNQAFLAEPIRLVCLEDVSDTWSHGLDRYGGPVHATGAFVGGAELIEQGPLRTTVRLDGCVGSSPCRLFVSLCRGEPVVRLRLLINYQEPLTVLKAHVVPRAGLAERRDRVAGGWVERDLNGEEYPVHHAMCLGQFGLVLPDTFAADCSSTTVRPTLIRNNYYALHHSGLAGAPRPSQLADRPGTDEGLHEIRLLIALAGSSGPAALESLLDDQQRPPYTWDDHRGVSRVDRFESGSVTR